MDSKGYFSRKFGISNIELLGFVVILVFSFFSFQHPDLIETAGSSIAILQGHFTDFYDYNRPIFKQNNYLISTYLLYAIWNIPVIVFDGNIDVTNPGAWIFWFKGLSAVFFFLTAIGLRKTAILLGFDRQKANLTFLFWISCPLAFFSNFIFGQYDILTIFFVVLALNKFLEKKYLWFTIFIAISLTFKYFPLFFYIPVLLTFEKNILKIAKHILILILPVLIEFLIFISSSAFKLGVLGFHVTQSFFSKGLFDIGIISINLFIFAWGLIVVYSYFLIIPQAKDYNYKIIYLIFSVLTLFFVFSYWHPQWLIFLTPFAVLTTMFHPKRKAFWLLDIVKMFFFIGYTVTNWPSNVDSSLMNIGVFPAENPVFDFNILMKDLFLIRKPEVYLSLFFGVLIFELLLKHPSLRDLDVKSPDISERKLLVLRYIIGVSIFVIPAIISFYV